MDENISIAGNFTNDTSNGVLPMPINEFITFHIFFSLLALLIIIANIAVLIVYFRTPQLHTNDNYLMINLAFADLFAGAINIPLIITSAFKFGKRKYYPLFFISNVLSDFTIISAEFNLLLIFLNRFLTICFPLRSRRIIVKHRIKILVALAWSLSVIIALMPITWSYKVALGFSYTREYYQSMLVRYSQYSLSVIACFFILPSIAMLVFLVCIIYSIKQHLKKRKQRSQQEASSGGASSYGASSCGGANSRLTSRSLLASYMKAFTMLLAMYTLMLIAWTPLMIIRFCLDLDITLDIDGKVLETFVMLRFMTSLVNPFIYTFIKPEFRQFFWQKIFCYQRV